MYLGLLGRIAESLAQGGDVLGQAVFADERVGPDQFQEFVLRDDVAGARNEYPSKSNAFGVRATTSLLRDSWRVALSRRNGPNV